VRAASAIGFPVAVKILSPQHSHKSDVGGVCLDVGDADALKAACAEMAGRLRREPGASIDGFCVQAMAPRGLELIVGFRRDPFFGPVVLAGLGGTLVEILRDVALRVAPISPSQAMEMLRELSGYPLLCGARGRPALDQQALADLISRFSELAAAAPRAWPSSSSTPSSSTRAATAAGSSTCGPSRQRNECVPRMHLAGVGTSGHVLEGGAVARGDLRGDGLVLGRIW